MLSISICAAEELTTSASSTASTWDRSAFAICAPSSEPGTMPGASSLATGHSTAPRPWCASTEATEVKQIVASEVAIAIFMM